MQFVACSLFSLIYCHAMNIVFSTAIDNGVDGSPLIECTTDSISVKLNTKKPFFGRIFVKGMSKSNKCSQDYSKSRDEVTSVQLTIAMAHCDMQRERQLNPAGLQQISTIIVSFHALFITKVDKAYSVRCFYMASGEKVITQEYQVSQITTVDFQQAAPMMPSCEYTVRRGTLTGNLVRYAIVGEKLFHVWKCLATGAYGILIRNCVVQDSARTQFVAIDTQGCTTDRTVLGDLSYGVNLDEAFVEVHAFKFADDVNVFFKCEITFCQRNPPKNEQVGETSCLGVTPPACNGRALAVSQTPTIVEQTNATTKPYKHQRQRSLNFDSESEYVSEISNTVAHFKKFFQNSNNKNVRVIDVVPKNNFVILDPLENGTFLRLDDRDADISKYLEKKQTTRQEQQPADQNKQNTATVGERWTFISLGFGIMSSLLVVSFLMIFVLIYMLCKRPIFDHSVYDHYSMSPVSTLRRILPRY